MESLQNKKVTSSFVRRMLKMKRYRSSLKTIVKTFSRPQLLPPRNHLLLLLLFLNLNPHSIASRLRNPSHFTTDLLRPAKIDTSCLPFFQSFVSCFSFATPNDHSQLVHVCPFLGSSIGDSLACKIRIDTCGYRIANERERLSNEYDEDNTIWGRY